MKINLSILFLLPLLFISFSNCTTDYFNFSESGEKGSNTDYSFNSSEAMAYCNKFNAKGFNGVLVAYYDWDQDTFNTNKTQLYLWNVPNEFTYPPTNYIQLHAFYIANNKTVFNKPPLTMEIIKNSSSETSSLVTTIGHDLLEAMGDITIDELMQNYSFILEDMKGWQGVVLSVFDAQNKPMKTTQILKPPFEANPHTYLDKHNREQLLFKLHPFEEIAYINKKDQTFYEKAVDFCDNVPIQFEVPAFETHNVDPVDQLIESLSFLIPDL